MGSSNPRALRGDFFMAMYGNFFPLLHVKGNDHFIFCFSARWAYYPGEILLN